LSAAISFDCLDIMWASLARIFLWTSIMNCSRSDSSSSYARTYTWWACW
jgi:hypothetical protein